MRTSALASDRPGVQSSSSKALGLGVLALLALTSLACTNVEVHVQAPNSGRSLTGLNCKLKRPLTNEHQQTNVWCWATSAHTVIQYLKNQSIKQCDLVQAVFKSQLNHDWGNLPPASTQGLELPNCCMNMPEVEYPAKETNVQVAQRDCYQNGFPEWVFRTEEFYTTFEGWEYDWSIPYPHGLSWEQIVEEICADRPIISGILYSAEMNGGSHAVVIGGYSELEDGSQWVHVYDPGYNTEEADSYLWSYEVYLGDPGVFTHVRDYKNISVQ